MDFLHLIFYGCLRHRFLDVETNPGPRRPVPAVCRILWVMCEAWPGTLVTWPLLRHSYETLLCFETLVSDMRHVSEVLVPGFGRSVLASGPWDGCIRSRWLLNISPTQIWVWLLWNAVCRVCGVKQPLCVVFIATLTYTEENKLVTVESFEKLSQLYSVTTWYWQYWLSHYLNSKLFHLILNLLCIFVFIITV